MNKRIPALLCAAALAGAAWVFAAGDADDPLISLTYLDSVFAPKIDQEVDRRLASAGGSSAGAPAAVSPSSASSGWEEQRLKKNDSLSGPTGAMVLFLSGSGQVVSPFGAVVDVTAGEEVPNGGELTAMHRYLVAEESSFVVTSASAVLETQGPCTLNRSGGADYYALASALRELGLFRGTGTGYGGGFDLERQPNRIQALIMFLRLLGEEEAALSWSGTIPFTDVARGTQSERYVGYAYEKGYTNGFTATEFRPSQPVSAAQYTEFLLRAMGYSVAGQNKVSDALARAALSGVFTEAEAAALGQEGFTRAHLAYLSYYALLAPQTGGGTLADKLQEKNVFTAFQWENVRNRDLGSRVD